MNITLENEKDNVVKLDITIPAKDAAEAYNNAVRRISQYINVDGFRRGKAPRAVVERHVGIDRIKQEALESILPSALAKAIQDNKLDIITQPYVTSFKYDVGSDMKVVAKVETRPEVTMGDYKGLTIKVEESEIPENGVQHSIDNLLTQHATLELVVDRPSNNTDIVNIDFEGFLGSSSGEKIQGGEGKNYQLDIAHSTFIPGFAEQLVGKNLNDEFEINVTFPADYHDEKLKGQAAVFKIKLNEIKERKLPEFNDEFVQKVSSFKTVAELKADIEAFLKSQKETRDKHAAENEVFKTVVDSAKVNIPQSMVEREAASLKEDYKQRLAAQGLTWEMVTKAQNESDLLKTISEDALLRIKNSLVIDKIAKDENIKIERGDIETKINEIGAAYRMTAADVLKQFGKNPEFVASLSQQVLNDKVRDILMANNKVEFVPAKKEKKEKKEKVESK